MLLRSSDLANELTKAAASVPGIPGLAGEGGATLLHTKPGGTQGRLQNLAAPRAKLKAIQGSRAYAPRLSTPAP